MADPPIDLDKGGRIPQTVRTYLGPTTGWKYTDAPTDIEYVIGGGTDTISLGYKGGLVIPDWLHVNNWIILAPNVGSIVIDVYKITLTQYLAGTIPSGVNSITGTDIPTLSSSASAQSFALTGWNTRINQNDFLGFNVNSISSLTLCTLVVQCVRDIGPS